MHLFDIGFNRNVTLYKKKFLSSFSFRNSFDSDPGHKSWPVFRQIYMIEELKIQTNNSDLF